MSTNEEKLKQLSKLSDKEKEQIYKQYLIDEMPTSLDKHQSILCENGILPNPNKFAKEFFKDKVKNRLLICPFCLNTNYLSQFIFTKGFYKCPICKVKMAQKTLEKMHDYFNSEEKIKVYDFAKWVFGYRIDGFWSKIMLHVKADNEKTRIQAWTNKLRDLGINYDFWDYYKKLKGEWKSAKQENEE